MERERMNGYRMFRRGNGVYYCENTRTGQQASLRTRDREEAERLLFARNEAERDSLVTREVGMVYLSRADPEACRRTWENVMDLIIVSKSGSTRERWLRAKGDRALRSLWKITLVDTRAEHFLAALQSGKVSTNVFLRRIHNYANDMGWLPRPIIPRRQWPAVRHKKRRAITLSEHRLILGAERNPERYDYYELLWYLGPSQGDLAILTNEQVNRIERTVCFHRRKTASHVWQCYGDGAAAVFARRPDKKLLFPYLASVRAGDRATEFKQRCDGLGIKGVSLHSYRYAWAQRAKQCAYPERWAMAALGHQSRAIHDSYATMEAIEIPSLEEYELAAKQLRS